MTTTTCPGCHGSGIEMSGVTYAGMSEYVGCHECGPECPDDCGCRASDAAEHPEFVAGDCLGATQRPDGPPSATEGLRGPEGAVTDAEAAAWGALADAATEGPWVVDSDGSVGAPMAGFVCGEYGHPRLDCSECGTRVCHTSVMPGEPDAAFVAAARTAVPRLLADRKRLMDALADEIAQRNMDRSALLSFQDRLTGERDRAIGFATRVEAENARLTEWQTITTRALDTACGVLQEASGLPDDIDDPDCRDEMVLALRPRAEKAEAENARLREGIEALAAEMEADETPPDEERYVLDDYANALLELLAEGGE